VTQFTSIDGGKQAVFSAANRVESGSLQRRRFTLRSNPARRAPDAIAFQDSDESARVSGSDPINVAAAIVALARPILVPVFKNTLRGDGRSGEEALIIAIGISKSPPSQKHPHPPNYNMRVIILPG
jgi:hypothetical protein